MNDTKVLSKTWPAMRATLTGAVWLFWHMAHSHAVSPTFSHLVGWRWLCSCGAKR